MQIKYTFLYEISIYYLEHMFTMSGLVFVFILTTIFGCLNNLVYDWETFPSRNSLRNEIHMNCLQWTPWLSADVPTRSGDWETISPPDDMGIPGTINRHLKGLDLCAVPVSIECRSRRSHIPWTDLIDHLMVPCVTNQGLVCRTQEQGSGRLCQDYEVRFLCWRPCAHFRWSSWLDFDNPEGEGDIELLGQTIPREEWPCEGGEIPVDVQCETTTGIPVYQSKKRGLRCNQLGFLCLNALQTPNRPCNDYKVRFLCPIGSHFPSDYTAPPIE